MTIPNVNNLKRSLPVDAQLPASKRQRVEALQEERVNERVLQTNLQPSWNGGGGGGGGGSSSSFEVFESNNSPPNSQEVQWVQQTAGRHFSPGVANHTPQTDPDDLLSCYELADRTPQTAPEYHYAQHTLGVIQFNVGDYQKAIEHLNIALLRYDNSDTENLADLQYFRCLCYCKLGKFEEALASSKMFLELTNEANLTSSDLTEHKLDDILFQVGKLAIHQQKFLDAEAFLSEVSSTSVHEGSKCMLGLICLRLENPTGAIEHFKHVTDPKWYGEAQYALGNFYTKKKQYEKAKECFFLVPFGHHHYDGSHEQIDTIILKQIEVVDRILNGQQ
jgi:hypothetical protein